MEPTIAPAQAATPQPALDLTPVIEAINGLRESLTPAPAAAAPITPGRAENMGNPLIEKYTAFERNDHVTRAQLVKMNFADLRRELIRSKTGDLGLPVATNTVDANLVNSVIAGDFLTTMRTTLAPLGAFAHKCALNPISARQVLNVNLVSSAGAVQSNPTNFETGDTTSTAKQVTVAHINRSFYAANSELDLGLDLMQKAPTNAKIMAEGIFAVVSALMTNANYGADVVIGTAANFDSADLRAVLALGKNYFRTTLLLDGGHLAYLLPTSRESFVFGESGAYGFDGGIYKNNLWTSAATDICGFVTGPDAIVWGAGPVAQTPNGEFLSVQSITLEGVEITVQAFTWFSRASRSLWASYDVCFGAAVGDATQAEVLTTQ